MRSGAVLSASACKMPALYKHRFSCSFLMSASHIPHHVAIIMDGNGRGAKSRLRPRTEGHRQGVEALNRVVEAAARAGIERLTVFAFSS